MILPIGDSPNPRGVPWITYALIAVNVAVYLTLLPASFQPAGVDDPRLVEYVEAIDAERRLHDDELRHLATSLTRYDLIVFEHGFRPGSPGLLDLLTAMFLHGGLAHLLGNMLFLWIFGDNVEHQVGRAGFLLAYLGTGTAAAFGDAALRVGSELPSVGASGAISGVLGLYFMWFPRNRVRLWFFLFPFFMDVIELPARWVLGVYIVVDNILPVLLAGTATGVSHGAHLGGFVAGLGAAGVWTVLQRGDGALRAGAPPVGPPVTPEELPARFRRALAEDRPGEAAALLVNLPRGTTRRSLSAGDMAALGEALEEAGQERGALSAYQRTLADYPLDRARARAHLGAARVLMARGMPTAAYQHLYAALEEDPAPDEALEARQLLARLAERSRSVPRRFL